MIITAPHQPEPEKYPGGRMLGLTIRGRRVGAGLTLRRCAELMGLTMTDLSAVEINRGEIAAVISARCSGDSLALPRYVGDSSPAPASR